MVPSVSAGEDTACAHNVCVVDKHADGVFTSNGIMSADSVVVE